MALASAVCDSTIGFRNSSMRISPGCGLGSRSVVVDDLDFVGMALSPDETDADLREAAETVGRFVTQPFIDLRHARTRCGHPMCCPRLPHVIWIILAMPAANPIAARGDWMAVTMHGHEGRGSTARTSLAER